MKSPFHQWLVESLLSPRLGIYLLLSTTLVYWPRLFFGYASAKTFWIFAVAELTLVVYLWFIYWRPSLRPNWHWQTGALLAYLVVSIFSTIFGVYPAHSFWSGYERNEGLLMWLHIGAIFPVLLSFFKSQKEWLTLAIVTCSIGLIVCVVYFLIHLSIYVPTISDNGGSTLGNSSYLGVYLLFEIFFASFLFLSGRVRWIRAFGATSFVAFVFTLIMTDARASTIAFFGGAILYAATISLLEQNRKKVLKRTFGALLLTLLTLGFAFTAISAFRPSGIVHQFIIEQTTGSRFVVADIGWKAFLERPLFGWGPENFYFAFLKYYNPCFGNSFCGGNTLFDHAHNIFFDTLVQTGALGLLSLLSILASIVASAWLAVRRHGADARVATLITALLAAYFVQNLTFFDISIFYLFLIILLALSIAMSSGQFLQDEPNTKNSIPSLPILPVLGSFLLPIAFFFFVIQPVRAGLAVFPATTERESDKRFEHVRIALDTSPLGRDVRRVYLGYGTAALLWSFHPELDQQKIVAQSTYLQKEALAIESALFNILERAPNDFRAYLYLTRLLHGHARLFDAEKFEESFDVVNEAIKRNPDFPRLRWVKTSLLLETGRMEEARESALVALGLNDDSARSVWNKFLFATYVGDDGMQKEAMDALEADHPNFARLVPEVLAYDREYRKYTFFTEFYSE